MVANPSGCGIIAFVDAWLAWGHIRHDSFQFIRNTSNSIYYVLTVLSLFQLVWKGLVFPPLYVPRLLYITYGEF